MPSAFRLPVTFLDRSGLSENHQGVKRVDPQFVFCPHTGTASFSAKLPHDLRCSRMPSLRTDPTPAGVNSHVYSRSNTRMLLGLL